MHKNLKWLAAPVLALCLLCSGLALAEDVRFDCDCTDIHMHVLPAKDNKNGCYTPVCGLEHAHNVTEYTCFDLDNPSCGKESKLHDLSCFTQEALEAFDIYNFSVSLPTNGKVPSEVKWPYVYSELVTYQSSTHQYMNMTDKNSLTLQMFLLGNLYGYKPGDTWATQPADMRYVPRENVQYNWMPAYCCDEAIGVVQYSMYKQVNPEDSSYFDEATAQKIRAVMMNSYPYYTMEEMQERLAVAGFENAELFDESTMIAATQLAVWNFSNGNDEPYDPENYLDRMKYLYTRQRKRQSVAAYVPATNNGVFYYMPETQTNVELLMDYLVTLAKNAPLAPVEGQIVISRAGVTNLAVLPEVDADGLCATLRVTFNTPLRSADGAVLNITATAEGGATATGQITAGQSCDLVLEGYQLGEAIDVIAEGFQYVDRGVYFFEPYTEDGNIRERSQNLVGIGYGLTPVACSVHLEPTALMVQKVNHLGAALTDAAFSLSYVSTAAEGGKLLIDTYQVDEKGQLTLTDLIAGATYELQEVATPSGYAPLSKPIRFRVLPGAAAKIELVEANAQAELADGVLTVINRLPTPRPTPRPTPSPTLSPTPEPTQLPLPPTGDSADPGAWAVLLMVSLLGAALLLRKAYIRT